MNTIIKPLKTYIKIKFTQHKKKTRSMYIT